MGTFYRSKHGLMFVFKKETAANINSFGLGETGRYRTNVWDYAGISSMSATRGEELAMHPTVKPVAMIEDTIEDCSKRREQEIDDTALNAPSTASASTSTISISLKPSAGNDANEAVMTTKLQKRQKRALRLTKKPFFLIQMIVRSMKT